MYHRSNARFLPRCWRSEADDLPTRKRRFQKYKRPPVTKELVKNWLVQKAAPFNRFMTPRNTVLTALGVFVVAASVHFLISNKLSYASGQLDNKDAAIEKLKADKLHEKEEHQRALADCDERHKKEMEDEKRRNGIPVDERLAAAEKKAADMRAQLTSQQVRMDDVTAESIWFERAVSPELSFKEMDEHIKARRILERVKVWVDEFEPTNTEKKWHINLKQARAFSDRWGKRWKVELKIGAGDWMVLMPNHDWDDAKKHVYGEDASADVTWRPNQPIWVSLTQIGKVYNAPLITRLIDGPVAIWQLNNLGWFYHVEGDDWVGIRLEVTDCPGPNRWHRKGEDR